MGAWTEPAVTLLVGVVSAGLGALVESWRARVQPWMTPLRVISSSRGGDRTSVSKELSDLTKKVYSVHKLTAGETTLAEINKAYRDSSVLCLLRKAVGDKVDTGTLMLKTAKAEQEVVEALKFLLGPTGPQEVLEAAIYSGSIAVPAFDATAHVQLNYTTKTDKKNGCFAIDVAPGVLLFGSYFNDQPFRRVRLQPMVELIARLQKNELAQVFENFVAVWHAQCDAAQSIREETSRIIDHNSRWLVEFSVANLSSAPLLLHTKQVEMMIKGPGIEPIVLRSRLANSDSDGDWSETDEDGLLLRPAETASYAAVTTSIEADLPSGQIVRGAFKARTATVALRIAIRGPGVPWRRSIATHPIPFVEKGGQ